MGGNLQQRPRLVSLSGLYLTDSAGELTKWAIPTGNLADGDFLTLWVDGETSEGSNHANFELSASGGEVYLTDGSTVIDTITYGVLASGTSLARIPDGVGELETTNQPTLGMENIAGTVTVESVEIYINEFMADNDTVVEDPDEAGAFEDWIELYNPGTESDRSERDVPDRRPERSRPVAIPRRDDDFRRWLPGLWADDDTDQGDAHAAFKLSADGETIALYNIDGATLIDSIEFGVQTTDVSYGRYPDGTENWISMTTPTPGAANVLAPTNVAPTAEAGRPLLRHRWRHDHAQRCGFDRYRRHDRRLRLGSGQRRPVRRRHRRDGQLRCHDRRDLHRRPAGHRRRRCDGHRYGHDHRHRARRAENVWAMPTATRFSIRATSSKYFKAGEYEDGVSSKSIWKEGGWNGYGDFILFDLVIAFETGLYLEGPAIVQRR